LQFVELPQAFVMVPHELTGQVGVGQVQSLLLQTSWFGHVEEHPIVPPQPFGALLQCPTQAFGFGWQHWPASQSPLLAHWIVPLAPQFTVLPHVSVAVPQERPAQELPDGMQASGAHVPQSSGRPQLSVTEPHRFLHHTGSVVQSHCIVDPSQNTPSPVPQMLPQVMEWAQLSSPGPQWSTHQETIGEHASAASFASASPAWASPPASPVTTSCCVVWSSPTASCEAASGYGLPSSIPQTLAHPTAATDAPTHSATRPTRNQGRRAPRTIHRPL
jgi:hypothetical protein